jgi:hypothetical protein
MIPETIPIRLMITWTVVNVDRLKPSCMTHSPFLKPLNATTPPGKLPQARIVSAANQACSERAKSERHA